MSQKQGCNFCTRQGLALLPVRPGNDIQKWLSCLWRKAPEGLYGAPAIYPTGTMEMDAFNDAIKPEDD